MADTQTERAYQKQPTIFQNKKRVLLGEGGKEKLPRYYKNIGLGFKTPKEAIEGTYIDKKCPFTGNVSIRGRILSGVVTKMKMQRTIVIRRDYLHYIRKYNRFEKRHKNMSVHLSPCFRCGGGVGAPQGGQGAGGLGPVQLAPGDQVLLGLEEEGGEVLLPRREALDLVLHRAQHLPGHQPPSGATGDGMGVPMAIRGHQGLAGGPYGHQEPPELI
ncbi:PREDICTED: 40S ribosomal protein S11 [Calidris pugnax]|uniref:40S ribosomal protein S11 n=1 Tax=Calidris pugnax TaxID=198806 RepID=UPI00071CAE64|nr:PREDICTED: 40S ribosomal protein S11 [Calidris pugnax]